MPQARVDVHRERAMVDAVIVGIGTVLGRRHPSLTVRDWPTAAAAAAGGRRQRRAYPADVAKSSTTARATLVAVGEPTPTSARRRRRCRGRCGSWSDCRAASGRVDLGALLAALYEREARLLLLVEGGATLAASFVRDRLVDRVVGYHAPMLLGAGAPVLGDVGIGTLAAATRLWRSSRSRRSATTSGSWRGCATTMRRAGRLMFTGIVEELGTVVEPSSRLPDAARLQVSGIALDDVRRVTRSRSTGSA